MTSHYYDVPLVRYVPCYIYIYDNGWGQMFNRLIERFYKISMNVVGVYGGVGYNSLMEVSSNCNRCNVCRIIIDVFVISFVKNIVCLGLMFSQAFSLDVMNFIHSRSLCFGFVGYINY